MNLGRSEYQKLKEAERKLAKAEKVLREIKAYAESMNWKSIVRKTNEYK
jgi:hypothetical protein